MVRFPPPLLQARVAALNNSLLVCGLKLKQGEAAFEMAY